MWKHRTLSFYFMGVLDKWTKKATTSAVETAKETVKQQTSDIFGMVKIGLTAVVIIFGGKHLIAKPKSPPIQQMPQPIVINNYYDRGYIPNGRQQGQPRKKH